MNDIEPFQKKRRRRRRKGDKKPTNNKGMNNAQLVSNDQKTEKLFVLCVLLEY